MEPLLDLDRDTFVAINTGMTNTVLDDVMPVWTELHKEPVFWAVIAMFVLFQILRQPRDLNSMKSKARAWLIGALILGASMGLADLVAYRGVKIWVERPRPEAAGVPVELRTHSHSGWSFPSNHAANNFALARTVQILAPTWTIPAYAFAATVAFSRVYVGVHYPLDVVFGGLIGFLCASFVAFFVRKIQQRMDKTHK